jgi:23S rRNA pseudouridine1911/1915/1917 synthase
VSSVKKRSPEPEIIYQNGCVFLVNKPSGWVTLRVWTYQGFTLQDWVNKNVQCSMSHVQGSSFAERNGIVHRLDKDTWGIVLGAKNVESFKFLQRQFRQREIKKEYWVLVRGRLRSKGEVVSPIGRLPRNRMKMGVTTSGKPAETRFKPIREYKINDDVYTLIKVWPKTGRTHQIRVHFKYLGHPVFGDQLYGGKKEENKKMFLVAKKIGFVHPDNMEKKEFEIDLPDSLRRMLINAEEK